MSDNAPEREKYVLTPEDVKSITFPEFDSPAKLAVRTAVSLVLNQSRDKIIKKTAWFTETEEGAQVITRWVTALLNDMGVQIEHMVSVAVPLILQNGKEKIQEKVKWLVTAEEAKELIVNAILEAMKD